MKHLFDQITSDFRCKHCQQFITTDPIFSGVNNRNHCPYCLWSRHLDLEVSGDRLSACKGLMQPIGLTLKERRKKYGSSQQGELMLLHRCIECGKLSINRIAADDLDDVLLHIYRESQRLSSAEMQAIQQAGIRLLTRADEELVQMRLFGGQPEDLAWQRSFA